MSQERTNIPLCVSHEAHHEIIDRIELPDDEHFFELAEFFSVIGDSTRIKILYLLFEGEISHKAIDVTGLFLAITVYPTYSLSIMARVPGSVKHHHSVGTNQIHAQTPSPLKHKPISTAND